MIDAEEINNALLVLEIDNQMNVRAMNSTAISLLGVSVPCKTSDLLDYRTCFDLREIMRAAGSSQLPAYRVFGLKLPGKDACRKLIGLVENIRKGPEHCLRATVPFGAHSHPQLEALIYSEELHRTFVQTASEAMWCIDFSEPVDLTRGPLEIVRQIFENDCRWLMCNQAMARLYDLPEGMDLNEQPVSNYFPRNRENEEFVKEIINSNFYVENALSIDTGHDGSIMYMENTVHCKIQDEFLLRMWGTTRDITGYRRTRNRLAREASDVRSILNAIPEAILVIDRDRRLLAVNAAFQALFEWNPYEFFGRDIQDIVDLTTPLPNHRKWYGVDRQKWVTSVKVPDGSHVSCNVQSFPIGDNAPERFVITLYPVSGKVAAQ